MAINEACQVWIEQRVREELDAGKPYRAIGREIAAEIERVFQAKVDPMALTMRAQRAGERAVTNVTGKETAQDQPKPELEKTPPAHGGTREGSGRKPKPEPAPVRTDSLAMRYAEIAISQLERIEDRDLEAEAALLKVMKWIDTRLEAMPMKNK